MDKNLKIKVHIKAHLEPSKAMLLTAITLKIAKLEAALKELQEIDFDTFSNDQIVDSVQYWFDSYRYICDTSRLSERMLDFKGNASIFETLSKQLEESNERG